MMWNHLLKIYEESRINLGKPECLFAETLVFNEGWLLRSVSKEWKTRSPSSVCPFLPFPVDAKIYSEGIPWPSPIPTSMELLATFPSSAIPSRASNWTLIVDEIGDDGLMRSYRLCKRFGR